MKQIKKLTAILCLVSILFATSTGVFAENSLTINNDMGNFSELMFMENGKTYMPIRLFFPNYVDEAKGEVMTIEFDADAQRIRITYGDLKEIKEIKEIGADGVERTTYEPVFTGIRNELTVYWMDDIKTVGGIDARYSFIKYDDAYLANPVEPLDDGMGNFSDKIQFKSVSGGDRVFFSVDDLMTIADLLIEKNSYDVTLNQ